MRRAAWLDNFNDFVTYLLSFRDFQVERLIINNWYYMWALAGDLKFNTKLSYLRDTFQ